MRKLKLKGEPGLTRRPLPLIIPLIRVSHQAQCHPFPPRCEPPHTVLQEGQNVNGLQASQVGDFNSLRPELSLGEVAPWGQGRGLGSWGHWTLGSLSHRGCRGAERPSVVDLCWPSPLCLLELKVLSMDGWGTLPCPMGGASLPTLTVTMAVSCLHQESPQAGFNRPLTLNLTLAQWERPGILGI